MSLPEKKVLKSKICCSCSREKDIKNFPKNAVKPDGFENRCRQCKFSNKKCKRGPKKNKPLVLPSDLRAPMLFNVDKQDWIDMYQFLKNIGYSLDRNIHEQFCEKHNLKTRKRMHEKSLQYSPQDLGLV